MSGINSDAWLPLLLLQAVVQLELQEFSMDILEDADRGSAGDGCQTDLRELRCDLQQDPHSEAAG